MLLVDKRFEELSLDAKVLYSLMLDRAALSSRNGWLDDKGRVYIIYTLAQVMTDLHCANQKVTKMMKALETIGLIERKRQGQGKPTLIYVKDFATGLEAGHPGPEEPSQDRNHEKHEYEEENSGRDGESQVQFHEKHENPFMKNVNQPSWKPCSNKTDRNQTEYSKTNLIYLSGAGKQQGTANEDKTDGWDAMRTRHDYEDYFRKKFGYEGLTESRPYDQGRIDEIIGILVDTVCSRAGTIRINGEEKPIEVVKSQFMKLESTHIEYILDCFHNQITDIRNIRQYLLTTLYNAPLTIDHYYTARVSYDMAHWQKGEQA
ncbi:MAG: DUF6017 domain-containing protein [Eubacteriales bacterium]|nr:DUF6017 domain-containing protein [Eubacteriales bacterium]